ncbi:MAG: Lpg1974 family pore-forming outer membrane protein [Simkaniaceae bacterium]|nr:Lpg1974 family pore-forming outer membrane protein [Simkaniaceae bacterium]
MKTIFFLILGILTFAEPPPLPNGDVRSENDQALMMSADLLYWTAKQDGLAYARDGVTVFQSGADVAKKAETQFPGDDWNAGFRVGIGLNLDHDDWGALLQFTRFTTDESSAHSGQLGPTWEIAGLQGVPNGNRNVNIEFQNASADWSLIFNTITLELGRNLHPAPYLIFRPHIGLAATWFKQTYETTYTNFVNLPGFTELNLNSDQNSWGIGMRSGFQSTWFFNDFWGFYGNGAIAALWTRFCTVRRDTATQTNTDTIQPIYNRTDFHTVKPYIDLSLGLRFIHATTSTHLAFSIGWEQQVFINQNASKPGDLITQGLTSHFIINF